MDFVEEVPCDIENVRMFTFRDSEGEETTYGVTPEEITTGAQNAALPDWERNMYKEMAKQARAQ